METRSKVTAPSFRRPSSLPDKNGYFGEFGGRFVSESLMEALYELEDAFRTAWKDNAFHREMEAVYKDFIGRPSPLYFAEALTEKQEELVFI